MKKVCLVSFLYVFAFCGSVFAEDFGKRGASFKIKEESILVMIQRKLKEINFEKEKEKMTKIAEDRVKNPVPVDGIMPATKTREFWHDPTYTLDQDAILPCGKVLHKAGTKVNPLHHMQLNRRLFFIDARQEEQIDWLVSELNDPWPHQTVPIEDRIILVAGSVFKLQEKLDKEVYFDQSGELTTKFGIKASPAVVSQDGDNLKIVEVFIEKK